MLVVAVFGSYITDAVRAALVRPQAPYIEGSGGLRLLVIEEDWSADKFRAVFIVCDGTEADAARKANEILARGERP